MQAVSRLILPRFCSCGLQAVRVGGPHPQQPMASPSKQSGQAGTKEVSTRKNFDKRTIRKMYSAPFESAITRESGRRSEGGGDQAVLQYSAQDVQVMPSRTVAIGCSLRRHGRCRRGV
jgi:hypothetical protein